MNDYRIDTPCGTSFTLQASYPELARMKADAFAQRNNILACRATLFLDREDCEKALGEFDLRGHQLPTTWTAFKELMSETRDLAKGEAEANWDFPCHYSRGVVLTATDAEGDILISTADCVALPTTLGAYRKKLAAIVREHPNATQVYAEAGYDGADSLYAFNNGDYQPWTGAWSALVWVKGYTDQIQPA